VKSFFYNTVKATTCKNPNMILHINGAIERRKNATFRVLFGVVKSEKIQETASRIATVYEYE